MNKSIVFPLVAFLMGIAQQSAWAQDGDDDPGKRALAHYQAAKAALNSDDAPTAVTEMKAAVELVPNNADLRNQLALAYYHNDEMQLMWEQLRKGAQIDPSNEQIAKGLLAYWNALDKQGLFNVGNDADEVTKALGKPDKEFIDGGRSRCVYGFLAIVFRSGKVYEIMDLRGLTPEHLMPQEYINGDLDGRGWKVAYRANNRFAATAEYTLPGEKIQQWSELVSVQRLHQLGTNADAMKDIVDGMMNSLKKTNPDAQWQVIDEKQDSILFEWKTAGNESSDAQHEIVRLFRSPRDLHRIAFVKKTDDLDDQLRDKWIDVLSSATLTPVSEKTGSTP